MNPTVLYILWACLGATVISKKEHFGRKDSDLTKLQYVDKFYRELQKFEDRSTGNNPQESDVFVKLIKTLCSDDIMKTYQERLLLEFNGTIKTFNSNLIIDEVLKGLQDFLSTNKNQARDEEIVNLREPPKSTGKTSKSPSFESKNHGRIKKNQDFEPVNEEKQPFDRRIARGNEVKNNNQVSIKDINNSLLNVTAQVVRHGYQAQDYTVQTKDGYVLGLHRINTKNSLSRGKRLPVLLMHGLLQNSASWLGTGPRNGLAFLLAKAGRDVWLGNTRGNDYSRAHASLDPESSPYWQFCSDEMGKYDLPAIFDKVLEETRTEKLDYIGFSQGCGVYFIMCSESPHYCKKANRMIAIAPSVRHLKTKSPAFRLLCEFFEKNENSLFEAGIHEVLPKNGFFQKFMHFFCWRSDVALQLCELFKDLVDSSHPGSFTKESILYLVSNFPSGTSTHNLARFGQALRSRSFHKFDYGPQKNLQIYGSPKAPIYNLSAVTVPTVVIYGRNDGVVDIDDVKWLIPKLPNVIDTFEVEDPLWTHLDVAYSQYAPRLLYPRVMTYLN